MSFRFARGEARVFFSLTLDHCGTGTLYARAYDLGMFATTGVCEFFWLDRRHFDLHVDPIKQWA